MQRLTRPLVEKRFASLLAARLLQLSNGFVVSVVLVWAHGLPAAGLYTLAMVPALVGSLVCGLGLANALPRQPLAEGERATIGLLANLATLPLLGVGCVVYGLLVGRDPGEAAVIALFALGGGVLGQTGILQCLYVLQGRTSYAPLTPCLHMAGTAAAVLADDLLGFAAILTVSRLAGCLAGFVPLGFSRTTWPRARTAVADGMRFVPIDLVVMASEWAPVPLLGASMTRAEIGLFGLAKQFVTLADTPGWSFIQTRYPAMVDGIRDVGPEIARRNDRLSWLMAAGSLAVATLMAVVVYRLPQLLVVLPVMLLPLPARYMNNFCDQALRAAGRVRECVALGIAKLALSLLLFAALVPAFGLWGAVAASAALSFASGLLYRWRLVAHYPRLLPTLRPWRFA